LDESKPDFGLFLLFEEICDIIKQRRRKKSKKLENKEREKETEQETEDEMGESGGGRNSCAGHLNRFFFALALTRCQIPRCVSACAQWWNGFMAVWSKNIRIF